MEFVPIKSGHSLRSELDRLEKYKMNVELDLGSILVDKTELEKVQKLNHVGKTHLKQVEVST